MPSAFTHTTGQAHWEVLLRARAVENLAYVAAAAQGGLHENGRRTWGHTMVVDPWGAVLARRKPRARAWCWPTSMPASWPVPGRSCPRWSTGVL